MRSDWSTGSWFLFTHPWLISSNITGSKYRSKFSKVQSNLDRNLLIRSQRTLWAEFYFLGISFGLWLRQDLLAFSKLEIQESRLHISCTQMRTHTHTAHLLTLSGCTFFFFFLNFSIFWNTAWLAIQTFPDLYCRGKGYKANDAPFQQWSSPFSFITVIHTCSLPALFQPQGATLYLIP